MDLTNWTDQLETALTGQTVPVDGIASLDAAIKAQRTPTKVWVLPAAERAAQNTLMGDAVDQRVAVAVGVIYAVRNLSDNRGQKGHEALQALRTLARAYLLGWQPDDAIEPVTFIGGRLLHFTDSTIWWRDDWATAFYIRKT